MKSLFLWQNDGWQDLFLCNIGRIHIWDSSGNHHLLLSAKKQRIHCHKSAESLQKETEYDKKGILILMSLEGRCDKIYESSHFEASTRL